MQTTILMVLHYENGNREAVQFFSFREGKGGGGVAKIPLTRGRLQIIL